MRRIAEVNPFTPYYNSVQIPITDVSVRCYYPYNGEIYILVIQNVLHVPPMRNNTLQSFMLMEAGIKFHEISKIQVKILLSINTRYTSLRTSSESWCHHGGVFVIFCVQTDGKIVIEKEEVYMLTPSVWYPCCSAYASNEESMLHWGGNMIEKQDMDQIFLSDIPEDSSMMASVQISSSKLAEIEQFPHRRNHVLEEKVQLCWMPIPQDAD